MEIIVTGKHLEITDPIRNYASEKVAKLPRYFDRVQMIEVLVDKIDNYTVEVEMIVRADHADPFLAKVQGPDLYACVDETVDKLERQLTEHKSKLRDRKHRAARNHP